jgi:Tol biopolymer transport system component
MELVEGETIAARLRSGPLPVKTAHLYASQVAAALTEAHGKGIIHRDLKPGNIMVAKSGVKVLDFGLAKSGTDEMATANHMVLLGTPGYTAPEQREGKPADARTDIYSFGCVLYEMLTGGRVAAQRKRIPSRRLEKIVNRCLEENPGRRWQSAAELERELAGVTATGSRGKRMLAGVAALGLIAIVSIWAGLHLRPASQQLRVQQLTTNSAENPIWNAVISPDGKYLAYGDVTGIQVRLIRTGESYLLPRPRTLSSADAWFPAAWFPDGTRLLANSITSSTVTAWTVSLLGGSATRLRENAFAQSVSPDGSSIAFVTSKQIRTGENALNTRRILNSEIGIMSAEGGNARIVVPGDELTYFGSVRWSPDGKRIGYQRFHLANGYFTDYTIESCDLHGRTGSLISSARSDNGFSIDRKFPEDFGWLADGRVIYGLREPAPNSRDTNLWAINLDSATGKPAGRPQKLTNLAGFHIEGLTASVDGNRLLFESSSDQSYVYVARVGEHGQLMDGRRLTPDERYNSPYAWSSDSRAVVFISDRTGTFALYRQALDQDVPELIRTGPEKPGMARVSPDGIWVIYPIPKPGESSGESRLMRVPLRGGSPQVILERTRVTNFSCPYRTGAACVISESSTDGKQHVFSSLDPVSGMRHELFRITRKPVHWVVSPDGSRLAMIGDDQRGSIEIWSLAGQIEARFQIRGWPTPVTIDWAADGKTLFASHPGMIGSPSGPIGTTLLRVDFQGHAEAIWETRGARYAWAFASPDGKYLAIRGAMTARNAWLLENF